MFGPTEGTYVIHSIVIEHDDHNPLVRTFTVRDQLTLPEAYSILPSKIRKVSGVREVRCLDCHSVRVILEPAADRDRAEQLVIRTFLHLLEWDILEVKLFRKTSAAEVPVQLVVNISELYAKIDDFLGKAHDINIEVGWRRLSTTLGFDEDT